MSVLNQNMKLGSAKRKKKPTSRFKPTSSEKSTGMKSKASLFSSPLKDQVSTFSLASPDKTAQGMDIPDEKDTAELNAIYAYNGYYNKSKGREEMLQKNTYFENLKDFVDEQLCCVASQISWKKALEKTKLECLMKLHWYEQEMKDDIKRGEKMQDDLD